MGFSLNARRTLGALAATLPFLFITSTAHAAGEADLTVPPLSGATFHGVRGDVLLMWGLIVCGLGLIFGMVIYFRLKNLPVHKSMRDVSELIYETCKTYLKTQGKFILMLWILIAAIIIVYFGFLQPAPPGEGIGTPGRVAIILAFSLLGIAGSYFVAAFGIRVNTFANSRTALASLAGKPYPVYSIPLQAGMSIGMILVSIELTMMMLILLFIPGYLAGACFIGFAIGESLGAAALRVAGGIFTKIADIGADLMKIVFNVKEDDARNPGVIADCTGDNAGDSVGPTADGFETYGVTGVALIVFVLAAVKGADHADMMHNQVVLLVWIFLMRLVMIISSGIAYLVNEGFAKARYGNSREMNFETPLSTLVWLASIVSVICTYIASYFTIADLGEGLWWKLSTIISCGTLAGAIIPEMTKVFTSVNSRHVREVVNTTKEGGASLNILSGLTAGNFSAFWIGGIIIALMAVAYAISTMGLSSIMVAEAVFAFGLVAFGFLSMGPVTIAVDSYGPVTDNAQSIYELSLIEQIPNAAMELKNEFNIDVDFERAKYLLEENDGAGNTFKATAKPVLIGTAVVGATTMIFSIIVILTDHLTKASAMANLSILSAPFLLGLLSGPAVIYWFSGASCQAVITGAYRAVEFIKRHMKLEGATKASLEDSKKVVQICTQYAQVGMINIFLVVFFVTLSAAFADPYFFVAFLISLAISGLFQAIFMANAGGAWDNAKKIVEVELREKGTDLHAATVIGDTVGDPFKDTSSVALNPIIKFSTLFGLLAVELAVQLRSQNQNTLCTTLSAVFLFLALIWVYRSFYAMRISGREVKAANKRAHAEPVAV